MLRNSILILTIGSTRVLIQAVCNVISVFYHLMDNDKGREQNLICIFFSITTYGSCIK